jgi:hypothetical protein
VEKRLKKVEKYYTIPTCPNELISPTNANAKKSMAS